jgi:glutaredoxin
MKYLILFLIMCSLTGAVPVHLFYGQGCPHCARAMSYLQEEDLDVRIYEVYFNQTNRELMANYTAYFNETSRAVPTIFVDEKIFVGFNQDIGEQIMAEIKRCQSEPCKDISELASASQVISDKNYSLYEYVGWAFLAALMALGVVLIRKR